LRGDFLGEEVMKSWTHPGGKLIEEGAHTLSQDELFEILIGSGYKGKTARDITKELLDNYFGIYGLWNKTFEDLSKIKGLKNGKIKRIAAPYEIGKRIIKEQGWHLPAVRKVIIGLPDSTDEELLAILISSGYKDKTPNDLARELLNTYHSLSGIMGQRLSDLAKITGLGDVKLVRIAAAYQIIIRLVKLIESE
jgi:DNA repair protein RadC